MRRACLYREPPRFRPLAAGGAGSPAFQQITDDTLAWVDPSDYLEKGAGSSEHDGDVLVIEHHATNHLPAGSDGFTEGPYIDLDILDYAKDWKFKTSGVQVLIEPVLFPNAATFSGLGVALINSEATPKGIAGFIVDRTATATTGMGYATATGSVIGTTQTFDRVLLDFFSVDDGFLQIATSTRRTSDGVWIERVPREGSTAAVITPETHKLRLYAFQSDNAAVAGTKQSFRLSVAHYLRPVRP